MNPRDDARRDFAEGVRAARARLESQASIRDLLAVLPRLRRLAANEPDGVLLAIDGIEGVLRAQLGERAGKTGPELAALMLAEVTDPRD